MQQLKDALVLVVGKNGEVGMPNPTTILITHSNGQHWFRIYPDAKPGSDLVFLIDDQGGCQAVAQSKWFVLHTLSTFFK